MYIWVRLKKEFGVLHAPRTCESDMEYIGKQRLCACCLLSWPSQPFQHTAADVFSTENTDDD